jgi:hypothetical protein
VKRITITIELEEDTASTSETTDNDTMESDESYLKDEMDDMLADYD